MSDMNKKNILIIAMMALVMAVGSISAYFTAVDSKTNTFTIGSVDIEQHEDKWDENKETDENDDGVPDIREVTPNKEILKDPAVENTGENDAYIYTLVAVPKKSVKVSAADGRGASLNDPAAGTVENSGNAQMTQLFQMNETANGAGDVAADKILASLSGSTDTYSGTGMKLPVINPNARNDARSWTGVDTFNDEDWYMLDVNPATGAGEVFEPYKDKYNIYLFAYGNKNAMTRLAGKRGGSAGATTSPLFRSVTFANAVNINDNNDKERAAGGRDGENISYNSELERTVPEIYIQSFAIQTENIGANNKTAPADVWAVLNAQDGAYANAATAIADLSADWQTAAH